MGRRRARRGEPEWASWTDEELLSLRLCDLGLRVEGSVLEERVDRLQGEFESAGLRFRPYVWLSDDWFTPDGIPGFAAPFYLAHPRLLRLERSMMYEAEGGNREACMRLLRHEAGHAITNAHRLHRRRDFRETFGPVSTPYRQTYRPRPYSQRFVVNLPGWYAQSHPLEDFAETFAVWLRPRSRWWVQYETWPALAKLEYVDELMYELADEPAAVRSRERPDSLPRIRRTLGEHYERKRARYGEPVDFEHDRDLLRLFSDDPAFARRRTAASFLRANGARLRRRVAHVTGHHPFAVEQVLHEMRRRCRQLGLRLTRHERDTRTDAAILLTTRVLRHHTGYRTYSR